MMTKVANERLAEMIAGLSVEAGPKETLGDVTARRLSIASPDELGAILTELLSLRNAQSEAVAVKPLEWKPNSASSLWTGELAFGAYYVAYDEGDGWRAFRRQFMSESDGVEVAFGAKGTVLSAAQADYEQRIRSALTHPAPPLAVTAWQFALQPLDTAPSGDDALEPCEIDVHEGSWAVLVGTNAKPIGWIDTHETFKGRTYRDRILPAPPPPLDIEFITLQTVPQGNAGQHLTVSVRTADGREAEVIRSWGGLPDISIYHTVTESGIADALTAALEAKQ